MPYATVEDITIAFAAQQWDPTQTGSEPTADALAALLTMQTDVLDGELATVVTVPVLVDASPHFYGLARQIVALRVRADVYDVLYKPKPSEPYQTRQSTVWRAQADGMVKRILDGHIADGTALGVGTPAAAGAPAGNFGSAPFSMGERW